MISSKHCLYSQSKQETNTEDRIIIRLKLYAGNKVQALPPCTSDLNQNKTIQIIFKESVGYIIEMLGRSSSTNHPNNEGVTKRYKLDPSVES